MPVSAWQGWATPACAMKSRYTATAIPCPAPPATLCTSTSSAAAIVPCRFQPHYARPSKQSALDKHFKISRITPMHWRPLKLRRLYASRASKSCSLEWIQYLQSEPGKIRNISRRNVESVQDSDRGDLLVDRMACLWRHQAPPHLGRIGIKSQYSIGILSNYKVQPSFKPHGMVLVSATADVFDAAPYLTNCLCRQIAFIARYRTEKMDDTWVGFSPLTCFANDVGIDEVHCRVQPLRRSKSASSPTFGMLASTSATLRRGGRLSAAFKISRCSASALRPLAAARCLSASATSSSTFRTTRLVAIVHLKKMQSMITYYTGLEWHASGAIGVK